MGVCTLSFAGAPDPRPEPDGPGCGTSRGAPDCDPEPVIRPSTPVLTLASSDSDGTYEVSWSAQKNATHYELQGESKAVLYSGRALSLNRTKGNGSYSYKVRACNGDLCSAYSASKTIKVTLPPAVPTLSLASGDSDGNYRVSWSAVDNATRYQVSGESKSVLYSGIALSLARTKVVGSYSYKVRACNSTVCSAYSATKTIQVTGSLPNTLTVSYQHTDMLGTPVMETDAEGKVVSRSVYEPFGKRLGGEKAGIGYTGHLQDTDLGLTYMQARYYDPLIGRFYSNDPVGFKNVHNFNRYAYANNNPYKYIDPDGRDASLYEKSVEVADPSDLVASKPSEKEATMESTIEVKTHEQADSIESTKEGIMNVSRAVASIVVVAIFPPSAPAVTTLNIASGALGGAEPVHKGDVITTKGVFAGNGMTNDSKVEITTTLRHSHGK
ncbi:RHS repeat-associated core domain-containing protein [Shewanella sp. KX20019]|uniref:RHS repeat-associated core domain-containing protein n=1 Tax=Shewanella sp. KX20019 TaxID=2803864 RepID=UPI001F340E7A|nr:RHS repeat-associated core domain-containing protein [Shewanella sp. KX20019]